MSDIESYRFEELCNQVSKLQHNFEGLIVIAVLAICVAIGCFFGCLYFYNQYLNDFKGIQGGNK